MFNQLKNIRFFCCAWRSLACGTFVSTACQCSFTHTAVLADSGACSPEHSVVIGNHCHDVHHFRGPNNILYIHFFGL